MEILFTTTDIITSKLIRSITKEPVSHCAIKISEFVVHSNFKGVIVEPYSVFLKTNKIIHILDLPTKKDRLRNTLNKYYGNLYDFGALFYLGVRYLLPKSWTKKQNLWQTSGMFLCTEFITEIINSEEDSMITPFQLYLRLKSMELK